MEDLTGRQFGPYRVVGILGQGGMAAVYKAHQSSVNRQIALKILSRSFTSDPQFLRRFQHEATIVAQLQHPYILSVIDFGESDGYAFLAMPLIKGGTLADMLHGRPLSLDVTERVIRQLGEALDYAHSKGVIHRDIKPSNILVGERGHYLLADFGIARMAEGTTTRLTQTGTVIGTPEYMSPEQAGGQPAGPASDIYSVGIVLYELLTGRVPFKADTPVAVAVKHLTAPLDPPRSLNPSLTPAMEAVVMKALARAPEDRFSSAEALANAFSAAVQSALSNEDRETIVIQPPAPTDPTLVTGPDRPAVDYLAATVKTTMPRPVEAPAQRTEAREQAAVPAAQKSRGSTRNTLIAAAVALVVVGAVVGRSALQSVLPSPSRQQGAFSIKTGDQIGPGKPGLGAGTIERPGAQDVYEFSAAPGQQVYFRVLQSGKDMGQILWRLVDSNDTEVFSRCLGCAEPGVETLTKGGTYTLTVGKPTDPATGDYRLQLYDVPSPRRFSVKIGDQIGPGKPGPGAGMIESPGAQAVYEFNATPGQQVYFRALQSGTDMGQIVWRLVDSNETEVFSRCLGCAEPGVQTLTKGGTYTLTVGKPTDPATGDYRLQLYDVPRPDRFSVKIGDQIGPGKPGSGAGVIESPGAQDVYEFSAKPGQQVYFRALQSGGSMGQIVWRLVDSNDTEVFNACLGCAEPGVQTLTKGGTYTLTVGKPTDPATGDYRLQLYDVPPPDRFSVKIGDQIGPGKPGPGAGVIESPGAQDVYQLSAAPGQQVNFRVLQSGNDLGQITWRLVDSSDTEVFNRCLGCGDPGVLTLTKGGIYTLTVGKLTDPATGQYALEVRPK